MPAGRAAALHRPVLSSPWGCCPRASRLPRNSSLLGLWASGSRLMAEHCCLFLGATRDLQGTVAPQS